MTIYKLEKNEFKMRFKNIYIILIFIFFIISNSTRAGELFIKPSAGVAYEGKFTNFSSSLAGGMEFTDGFSFFISIAVINSSTFNWELSKLSHLTTTFNGGYELPIMKYFKPYIFLGTGLELVGDMAGVGVQCGLGIETELTPGMNLFVDGKTFTFAAGGPGETMVGNYFPIFEGGFKLSL